MSTTHRISNSDDVIDSRDIIARIEELRTKPVVYLGEPEELQALMALASESADYAEDWEYGVALIRDSYFVAYAKELADDLGLPAYADAWPFRCIDWEQAARELRSDYTAVDFDGVTYWVR